MKLIWAFAIFVITVANSDALPDSSSIADCSTFNNEKRGMDASNVDKLVNIARSNPTSRSSSRTRAIKGMRKMESKTSNHRIVSIMPSHHYSHRGSKISLETPQSTDCFSKIAISMEKMKIRQSTSQKFGNSMRIPSDMCSETPLQEEVTARKIIARKPSSASTKSTIDAPHENLIQKNSALMFPKHIVASKSAEGLQNFKNLSSYIQHVKGENHKRNRRNDGKSTRIAKQCHSFIAQTPRILLSHHSFSAD